MPMPNENPNVIPRAVAPQVLIEVLEECYRQRQIPRTFLEGARALFLAADEVFVKDGVLCSDLRVKLVQLAALCCGVVEKIDEENGVAAR